MSSEDLPGYSSVLILKRDWRGRLQVVERTGAFRSLSGAQRPNTLRDVVEKLPREYMDTSEIVIVFTYMFDDYHYYKVDNSTFRRPYRFDYKGGEYIGGGRRH